MRLLYLTGHGDCQSLITKHVMFTLPEGSMQNEVESLRESAKFNYRGNHFRIKLILKERVKISPQNSAKMMKIG